AGVLYDASGTGAVLRRAGEPEKCTVGPGAMSRHRGIGGNALVGGWLFALFFARFSIHRRVEVCVSSRSRRPAQWRLLLLGFAKDFCDVSDCVCDHRGGLDHGCGWRTDRI